MWNQVKVTGHRWIVFILQDLSDYIDIQFGFSIGYIFFTLYFTFITAFSDYSLKKGSQTQASKSRHPAGF